MVINSMVFRQTATVPLISYGNVVLSAECSIDLTDDDDVEQVASIANGLLRESLLNELEKMDVDQDRSFSKQWLEAYGGKGGTQEAHGKEY